MDLDTDTGEQHRAVCFAKDRYPIFMKVNDSNSDGVILKRIKLNDNDILITDYTQIKVYSPDEERKVAPIIISKIASVMAECSLFDRVNIKGILSHISPIETYENDGRPVKLRKCILHDDSGFCCCKLFGELSEQVEENKPYLFTHLVVNKYKSSRLLKSCEVTVISDTVLDIEVDVSSHEVAETKRIKGESDCY